jgi:hypothetical protein
MVFCMTGGRAAALALGVALAGCSYLEDFSEPPTVLGGDANSVQIRTEAGDDPAPMAKAHCARQGKSHVYLRSESIDNGFSVVHYYSCT